MKGFFEVIYLQPMLYLLEVADSASARNYVVEEWGDEIGFGGSHFIAKKHVVRVMRYDTLEQHCHNSEIVTTDLERLHSEYEWLMTCFLKCANPDFKCTCEVNKILERDEDLSEALRGKHCTCDTSFAFPVYELTVENFHQTQNVEGMILTPKTCTYLLHPREAEHMERFLAGTDDPLYDFVHALQYLPPSGVGEVAQAAQRFETHKRQKVDEKAK